ncbi:unnamed protein product [Allacma fusca]|uniref:Uncharacterized protein n=1 Tax=Allacma fusca TaxID=39272 RepID=A0A8J2PMC1_9HEXA|nr:unnamed protein product [Allacma fusca]
MDFNIDRAFGVLKDELTALFMQAGELFTKNFQTEGIASKTEWFTWIFIFIMLGLLLALLRQKGIISTFNKDRTVAQEDEAEEVSMFTQEGIRRRSSYFLKLLEPDSERLSKTSLFTGHGEFKGIQSSSALGVDTSRNKKVDVSLLLASGSRKNK